MADVVVTEANNGTTVHLQRGDRLVVRLDESPTNGYLWGIESPPQELLLPESSTFELNPASQLGGGGIRAFNLRAARSGVGRVQLALRRHWEPDQAAKRFAIDVSVT